MSALLSSTSRYSSTAQRKLPLKSPAMPSKARSDDAECTTGATRKSLAAVNNVVAAVLLPSPVVGKQVLVRDEPISYHSVLAHLTSDLRSDLIEELDILRRHDLY